jgi:hypothetical protein
MTETDRPRPAPPRYTDEATAVAVPVRLGEWGTARLVREFIRAALRQPALRELAGDYIFDIPTTGDEPPTGIGGALRLAIVEILGTTTTNEDWENLAWDLLDYVRECFKDEDAAASPPSEGWAPPRRAFRSPRRWPKQPVRVEPSEILVWLTERGSATTSQIAQHFDISESNTWLKANALVDQGKLEVMPGGPHRPRIYSIPAAPRC